jgi:hypothetical protein
MGCGRFDGVETARVMGRLYAAARLYVNFFQPSFKLKEKRREGAKVIKRYHEPSTPYERALAHPMGAKAVNEPLRAQYRTLDPVALLAEIRAAQEELGNRSCHLELLPATPGNDYLVHERTVVVEVDTAQQPREQALGALDRTAATEPTAEFFLDAGATNLD